MEANRPTPLYVTVRKAKKLTGIDRPLEAAIAAGLIPVVRAGKWRRVRLEYVLDWAEPYRHGRPAGPSAA